MKGVSCRRVIIKNELTYKGLTLLTYKIEYPEFYACGFGACLRFINKYYTDKALEYKRYCDTELFGMAVEQYLGDVENNFPIRAFEAMQVFKVTCLCGCIISLWFDRYEFTGGAHGNTVRTAQTWNLQSCVTLKLSELALCPSDYMTCVLTQIEKQIEENPNIYFENYRELIAQNFNKDSFYCTSEGIVVYYQQYDIAPYSSGIPQFLLPYGCCVINPVIMCG